MKSHNLKISTLFIGLALTTFLFISCSDDDNDFEVVGTENVTNNSTDETVFYEIGETHEAADDYVWDSSSTVKITLNGSLIIVDGDGATVNGSKVTINTAGNYEITGTLNDGQIKVDTGDEETVRLILNGIDVTNTSSAPLYISNAEKTIIILKENTTNYLTDTNNYVFEEGEDEPNATLFSDDNLTIYGEGTLIINANYNDGIASKDGLLIASGFLNVSAVDDGIRGKDYMVIKDGDFTVNSVGDAFKSDNGWIQIKSGTYNINAIGDGITAESTIVINYGDFTIQSGGGSNSYLSSDDSAKGIKSNFDILIEDGIFNMNSSDDNIHSTYDITINTGIFTLATGDDAIHSDDTININGGEISITDAVEGIESPRITINNGEIYLTTSDDAINAAGNTNNYLYLNGGYIVINASGDGLDANGDIVMTAGTVIINGPTAQNNSPVDYDGTFKLDGGFLVASGYASNMDEAGSSSSHQNSVLVKLSSAQLAGNLFHIENSSGENIMTFQPQKKYKSIVFSSPELSSGAYKIYLGGGHTGTETNGIYENGTYSPGTLYKSFTISNKVTTVN
ncbi:carbohydrate-binding domain-containing protein [Lutibacter citreus]|uniref:carbohydrate-binding domain-containing protein n=1 Tax=Lutibacter citreus TaxID=2138210 RepID=UPI000DBE5638|nr:carbohydrate-binding domain-containing protein [Lutibacter citreus]